MKDGGGSGIRTLEGVAPLLVFKTSAFNRSANPPNLTMRSRALQESDNTLSDCSASRARLEAGWEEITVNRSRPKRMPFGISGTPEGEKAYGKAPAPGQLC